MWSRRGEAGQLIFLPADTAGGYAQQLLFNVPELIYHVDLDDDHIAIAARLNSIIVYQFSSGQLMQLSTGSLLPAMVNLNVRQNLVSAATFAGDLYTFDLARGELRHRIRLKRGVQEVRALSIRADGQDILTAIQGDVLFIPNAPELLYEKFCRYLAAMQICPGTAAR